MLQFGDMIYHGIRRYVSTIYAVLSTLQRHDVDIHMPQVVNQVAEFDGVLLFTQFIFIC